MWAPVSGRSAGGHGAGLAVRTRHPVPAALSTQLFGLSISEGAITNIFRRAKGAMETATTAIAATIRKASVVASDETTTRVNGQTQWQWAFIGDKAVLHTIAPRRTKAVAEDLMAGNRPRVWISDRYSGQQGLADEHQVCLAHYADLQIMPTWSWNPFAGAAPVAKRSA